MRSLHLLVSILLAASPSALSGDDELEPRMITERVWHFGDDEEPEWTEAPVQPEGHGMVLEFQGMAFEGEGLLRCMQRHVNNTWVLKINDVVVAELNRDGELAEHYYAIPAGLIRDGSNRLSLTGDTTTDDITFGALQYYPASFREFFKLHPVTIRVTDDSGAPLPARITITDRDGELAEVYFGERLQTAVRKGVVYTADGIATFELPRGDHQIYSSRGMEWSMSEARLNVGAWVNELTLVLKREVDTTGFVAADTHIHTLTYSGHGDSSVEERLVTLAGEGVELAIATDHNHNTDYEPVQKQMGLGKYFTPVVGNEVTTPIGHLNGFPLDPDDEIPPHDLHDIAEIVAGIRAKGATTVVLNHPRWPDHSSGPHGKIGLNHHTGEWLGNWACTFDAVELINSDTKELEPLLLFKDWFALLNRGERIFAVGSSDSHAVGVVVGQGRTYVKSSTDDPMAIHVESAAHNIANGHSSISMGIFADMLCDGKSVMGETIPLADLELRFANPSWVHPRKLTVFANGIPVLDESSCASYLIPQAPFHPTAFHCELLTSLDWPSHDFWVVALVEGDPAGDKWWPLLNDYTLAATNPVFIDVDGDGVYTHPRALAQNLLETHGTGKEAITRILGEVDSSVAAQLMRLVRLDYLRKAEAKVKDLVDASKDQHPNLKEWFRSLPN